ncbi:MAG: glycosyltransferase family 2 protein, partial [Candidatus Nanoarchaeia archaeon]|nr:glycosyltransferase family 2 protein [Candidatus Nanoarchaeia archaeon]
MTQLISVIIPVYNEEKAAKETIESLKKVMGSINYDYEIITINDCSEDESGEILDKINGIKVLHNQPNRGYGASLKRGIREAKGKWILITDADGTYPINEIPNLVKHINDYDMVIGARNIRNTNIPLLRRVPKWFLNKFAGFLVKKKIPD